MNKEFEIEDFEDYKKASTEKLVKLFHKQQDYRRQCYIEYDEARAKEIGMQQELNKRFGIE